MVFAAMFVAMTAVCAQIMLLIPVISTVQFSMIICGVFMAGAMLPPSWAFGSMVAYLLLGAVGAPVFGGFRGGLNVLMGVTGGFLCSYPLMALLIAWILKLARKAGKEPGLSIHVAAMALSLVFCYLFGAAWFVLAAHATVGKAFASCVIPFVVPDLLKAVLASAVAIAVKKRLKMA
jgi:biotin transport system substrate-specific component